MIEFGRIVLTILSAMLIAALIELVPHWIR
jgi:hypothetical protein